MRNFAIVIACFFLSCAPKSSNEEITAPVNILWIVAEDLSPIIPSFGDSTIITPHLSRLAREGVCYDRVFSPSGVCAPSRAAIATGMYPTRFGANNMRTGPWFTSNLPEEFIKTYVKNAMPEGIPAHQAVPPPKARMMSEHLRKAGYYCTNNAKEDYQFLNGTMAWDESSNKAHWRNRAAGQPFFSIFNINVTHESQIWAKANDSLWVEEDLEVPVPPYLPSTDSSLIDIRRMYSNIKEMDTRVGEILMELEEDGLLESTVIFWYTDHGGPLPRQKRLTYDSGLHVPMIVRHPNAAHSGTRNPQLVSFIDFAPTILSLAGLVAPDHMNGQAFLGTYKSKDRGYIHAAADRFDEGPVDHIRAVRDDRYKLIKYYNQELPMFYHVNYRDQQPIMRELHRLRANGLLSPEQALWFRETKPEFELFDTASDPHELHNLIDQEPYQKIRLRLQEELNRWITEERDLNLLPEAELLEIITDNGKMNSTSTPIIKREKGSVEIVTNTQGASIGYQLSNNKNEGWSLYKGPIELPDSIGITAVAHRLGYKPSNQVKG